MSDSLYVVLRNENDTVETIGPAGAKFGSFDEADSYAKAMRDRYTAQSFVVCEAVTAYETQLTSTVKKFGSENPKPKQKKLPKQDDDAAPVGDDENIFPMHRRKAVGK